LKLFEKILKNLGQKSKDTCSAGYGVYRVYFFVF